MYVYSSLTKSFVSFGDLSHTDEIVSMLETFKVSPVVIQAAITTLSQVKTLYSYCVRMFLPVVAALVNLQCA